MIFLREKWTTYCWLYDPLSEKAPSWGNLHCGKLDEQLGVVIFSSFIEWKNNVEQKKRFGRRHLKRWNTWRTRIKHSSFLQKCFAHEFVKNSDFLLKEETRCFLSWKNSLEELKYNFPDKQCDQIELKADGKISAWSLSSVLERKHQKTAEVLPIVKIRK